MIKNTVTKEILLKHGYKEYEPCRIDSPQVVGRYQKTFSDDCGRKYYINVTESDLSDLLGETDYYRFSFDVQFHKDNRAVNIVLFGNDWTVEEAENMIESMWTNQHMDYYERWIES